MWRSTDSGATWDKVVADYPLGIYDNIKVARRRAGKGGDRREVV